MKSFNILKKESKTLNIKFQKLEKNQLGKIIGGTDDTVVVDDGSTDVVRTKSRSNIRGQRGDV